MMYGTESNPGGMNIPWNCAKCGQPNAPTDQFCRRCGSPNGFVQGPVPPAVQFASTPSSGKKIIWLVLIFVMLIAVGLLGYFGYAYWQNKLTGEYLSSSGSQFQRTVTAINGLSTDKSIEASDDLDVEVKRLQEEKDKSASAVKVIKDSQTAAIALAPTKTVAGLDASLKKYYQSALESVVAYDDYYTYNVDTTTIFRDASKDLDMIKEPKSAEELVASLKSLKASFDGIIKNMNEVPVPQGMEEAHEKSLSALKKITGVVGDFLAAFEAKDEAKLLAVLVEMEGLDIESIIKSSVDLEKLFFEGMHDKFIGLRKEADGLKSEFMKIGTKLNLPDITAGISIEGW